MVEEAKAFSAGISEKASAIRESIQSLDIGGLVHDHPIAMACAALGIGYVLGGGLFSRTTGWLLKNGVRLAVVIPIAKSQLAPKVAAVSTSRPKRPKRRSRSKNAPKDT